MMYYRISKNEKNLFFGKKIAQVWAVTLSNIKLYFCTSRRYSMRVIGQNKKPITKHAIYIIWPKTLIFSELQGVKSI